MNFFRFSLLVDADEVSPFLSLLHKQKRHSKNYCIFNERRLIKSPPEIIKKFRHIAKLKKKNHTKIYARNLKAKIR